MIKRTSKLIACVPVEYPVPAKKSAKPKFLKLFNRSFDKSIRCRISKPMSSPTIRIAAVLPIDMLSNGILKAPIIFPISAITHSNINS